jgi:hypothetical protein
MHGRLDECVAEKFVQSFGCTIPKDAWKNQVDFAKKMAEKIKDGSCKSEYCLNESCSKVECKDGLNFCGGINVYYSNTPVSLAWVDDFNPKNEIGVSSFPLNPNEKGKWYIWKGSENKPLLVWDPKDTKSIKDAKQLFGQYTFGKTWRDGFEALASLDKDKDGKVSGMELDGLALWFDKNQDGVSTSAEIKSLEEVGVIALYYTKTGDNTRTGDIIVSKGYTRTDNAGNSITGRAIDWMANKAYSTKDEALKDAAKEKAVRDERQANARTSFGGIWVWSIDNESVTKEMASPVGSFILSEKDGILKGVSASGIALQNSKNINNVVNLSFLEGKRLSKNSNKVKFITIDKNGLKTETTAEISADGSSLTGVSRAEVYLDNKKNKQTAHYTWKAIRNL